MRQFTGLEYMKIYLANTCGQDKKSWDDRLAFADEVLKDQDSINAALETADEPNLMLKTLNALDDVHRDIPTGFIMGLDATASGLQIMAALSGCHKTARQVNLINTGKREDPYTGVTEHMNKNLSSGVKVPRNTTKYGLMTHFYNSKAKPKELFGEDSPELGQFYASVAELFPGAEEVRSDLQSCWRDDVLAHKWTLPDGHTAYVRVYDEEEKKIELNELQTSAGNNATFTYKAKVYREAEYGISLPANVIHSIDAWVVRELRRRCKKSGFDMIAVHDQFFCSPNWMNELRQHYLDIMCWIADSNLMQDIISEILETPVVYTKNSDNLSEAMRGAEYAVC